MPVLILLLKHGLLRHNVVLRQRDHLVSERSRDLFQRLVSRLWEVEVRNDEEEQCAADEDVVVVLSDVGEGRGSGFGDGDVDLFDGGSVRVSKAMIGNS